MFLWGSKVLSKCKGDSVYYQCKTVIGWYVTQESGFVINMQINANEYIMIRKQMVSALRS